MFLNKYSIFNLWQYSTHTQTTLTPIGTWLMLLSCCNEELCMHALSQSDEYRAVNQSWYWRINCHTFSSEHFPGTILDVVFGQLCNFFDSVDERLSLLTLSCRPLLHSTAPCRWVYTVINTRMFHQEPDNEIMVQLKTKFTFINCAMCVPY